MEVVHCSSLQNIELHWCIHPTARYQSDLEGEDAIKLAERFYCEAALINPDIGKSTPERQKNVIEGCVHGQDCFSS